MFKLLSKPPIIAAVYLVAMNWLSMYKTPGIIGIPVLFEIMAFIFFFFLSALSYWLMIIPTGYLLIKLTGSPFGGVIVGIIYACAIPCILVTLDYPDLSWPGALGTTHLYEVMLPIVFMSVYGYFLLHRYLQNHYGDKLVPWLTKSASRLLFTVVIVTIVSVGLVINYFNQPPELTPVSFSEQDDALKGDSLLIAHQHVIRNLLDRRTGVIRAEGWHPLMLLENQIYWEQGAAKQMDNFSRWLDHTSFFFENPVESTPRRPQVPYLLETPADLKEANNKVKHAMIVKRAAEAEKLYEEALVTIEDVQARLFATDIKVKGARKLKWWFQDAAMHIATPGTKLKINNHRINEALNPDKYSPRSPARFAIQPLWIENDALYAAYGSAWALSVYLEAVKIEYGAIIEQANAMPMLERVQQELEQVLPGLWTPVILTPNGISELQQEIQRVGAHMQQAMEALNEVSELLPR